MKDVLRLDRGVSDPVLRWSDRVPAVALEWITWRKGSSILDGEGVFSLFCCYVANLEL